MEQNNLGKNNLKLQELGSREETQKEVTTLISQMLNLITPNHE